MSKNGRNCKICCAIRRNVENCSCAGRPSRSQGADLLRRNPTLGNGTLSRSQGADLLRRNPTLGNATLSHSQWADLLRRNPTLGKGTTLETFL